MLINTEYIQVTGARTHNLKNVDVKIKKNALTCLSGPSGSGKSSLAFHTLLAESKRRFLNSLPSSSRFFANIPPAVDVDSIFPIFPVWGLPQINPVQGSRMNILDLMGLTERLQKIFFLLGTPGCPVCQIPLVKKGLVQNIAEKWQAKNEEEVLHLFVDRDFYLSAFNYEAVAVRFFNAEKMEVTQESDGHNLWEILRIKAKDIGNLEAKINEIGLIKKLETVFIFSTGLNSLLRVDVSGELKCPQCDYIFPALVRPDLLSAERAYGACKACQGYGSILEYDRNKIAKNMNRSLAEGGLNILQHSHFSSFNKALLHECKVQGVSTTKPMRELTESEWEFLYEGSGKFPGIKAFFYYLEKNKYKKHIRIYNRSLQSENPCPECLETRINEPGRSFLMILGDISFSYEEILAETVEEIYFDFLNLGEQINLFKDSLPFKLSFFEEIQDILDCAMDLGLGKIPLTFKAKSLSASEYQRSLLVKYLSFKGEGSLFVLDEPSVGLTRSEQEKIIERIKGIVAQGNTVIVIDHSAIFQKQSECVILMGPGAGSLGGEITFQGSPTQLPIDKAKKVKIDLSPKLPDIKIKIKLEGGSEVKLVSHRINLVNGPSYSIKEKVFSQLLPKELNSFLETSKNDSENLLEFYFPKGLIQSSLFFTSHFARVSERSTVGTALDIVSFIRKYFVKQKLSKLLNLKEGHFSPNSELGMCPTCEGKGKIIVDLQFLEDVTIVCGDCDGRKLRPKYANITDGQFTFFEATNLPLEHVLTKLPLTKKMQKTFSLIQTLKLGHLSIDRTIASLSGGERLRLKMLEQLQSPITDSLLVFQNLTFGLAAVGSSRVDLQACKLEYSIVSPK